MTLTERTTAALAWLDNELAICNAATPPPWDFDGEAEWVGSAANGAFIAAARSGYHEMLEGMKVAIEQLTPEAIPYSWRAELLEKILTKIEKLK